MDDEKEEADGRTGPGVTERLGITGLWSEFVAVVDRILLDDSGVLG